MISLKKRTLITLIFSFVTLFGIMAFLCVGKAKKITIEDVNGTTTLTVVRGDLLSSECSLQAPIDADVKFLTSNSHDTLKYISENFLNRGYTNDQVIQGITDYMNSKNGKVVSVKDQGYEFSGLNWIVKRLSNMK